MNSRIPVTAPGRPVLPARRRPAAVIVTGLRRLRGDAGGAPAGPRASRNRTAAGHRRLPAAAAAAAAVLAAAACGPARPPGTAMKPACSGPAAPLGAAQLRAAYQAPPSSGTRATGAGTVVAVIVPSAGPHVAADLAVYSRRYGLPVPKIRMLSYGRVPPPSGSDDAGWQMAATLQLEMVHVLAPQAQLAYLAVPPNASGGMAMYDTALAWLVTRYRVTVVTYDSGIPEDWVSPRLLTGSRAGLEAAARAGTTVVAASGDHGPAEPAPGGGGLRRTVAWPASDPLATTVGGTQLTAVTARGHTSYTSTAFSYEGTSSDPGAGGAGLSAVFSRPSWQDGVRAVVGSRRGVADIAMDASAGCSPVTAYLSTPDEPGDPTGWITTGGTSVAAPLFAGVAADAAQAAGHGLGVLGPALYRMHGPADGITDVTSGSDTIPAMTGYPAKPGYDLPTGNGTVASITAFSAALARPGGSRQ